MTVKDEPKAGPDATLTTPKAETPTYSQEQLDKAVRDSRSAVLADVGRAKKTAEEALARLNQLEKERAEAELEAARDEPDKLTAIRERQQRKQLEAELAQARQELNETGELVKQHKTEEIATRMNVDPVRLAKLAKFTDGSTEAIEDLAKELPKKDAKPPLKPDSSGVLGGSLSREEIIANYIKDPRNLGNRERYYDLKRKEGR